MPQNIKLYKTSWPAYVANIGASAVGGSIIYGSVGCATATSATFTDELLINRGYVSKHYLTSSALWSALILPFTQRLAEIFPQYSSLIYSISAFALVSMTYAGHDPVNYQDRIDAVISGLGPVMNLYDSEQILSKRELNKLSETFKFDPVCGIQLAIVDIQYILHNKLLMTIGGRCVISFIKAQINSSFIKYAGNDGNSTLLASLISKNPGAALVDITLEGLKISVLWFGKDIINSGLDLLDFDLRNKLSNSLQEKIIALLLNKENAIRILQLENPIEITENVKNDFNQLLLCSKYYINDITTDKIIEFIAFQDTIHLNPEMLFFSQIVNIIRQKISLALQKYKVQNLRTYQKKNTDYNIFTADLKKNLANILLTDSTDFIQKKSSEHLVLINSSVIHNQAIQQIDTLLSQIIRIISNGIETLYFSFKFFKGELSLFQIPLLKNWSQTALFVLSEIKLPTPQQIIAEERIAKLINIIAVDKKTELERLYFDNNKISINNYILKVGNNEILKINNLEFILGKHYAISGVSSIGKTSFLKDLKGVTSFPLNSCGTFSFPRLNKEAADNKLLFIDQNLYFPAKVTLLETITLKTLHSLDPLTKKTIQAQIIQLFKELAIDKYASANDETQGLISLLEDSEFNLDNLSGGQKRKIAIVKAIIHQPQILIMDEIFVGLDQKSLVTAQQILTKYLPNSLMIIVDHTAEHNNYNNFYDSKINFTSTGYNIGTLQSKIYHELVDSTPALLGVENPKDLT